MKSNKLRIVAIILAALFVVTAVSSAVVIPAFAKSASQIESDIAKLEKEQQKLEKELKELAQDAKDEAKYQETLDKQIESMETQITKLESQINALNQNIAKKEKEIEEKSLDIEKNYDLMLERLSAMQLAGEYSMLNALFTAESFSDLLTRAEVLQAVAERDQQLIERLSAEKRDIEAAKQEIVDSKKKLETSKKSMNSKKSSLQSAYEKSKKHTEDINKEKADYEKRKDELDKEEARLEEQLQEIYKENPSEGSLSPGGWMFPLSAKLPRISSKYGPRWGSFHKGVDLTCTGGSNGKTIVASKSGKVIKAVTNYTPNVGYGKYLIIDHGGGYSTLYAHCSQLLVSQGDQVKQGQAIAKVGNTGHSFGAHLHFEVRVNGQHTQPMNYIKLP